MEGRVNLQFSTICCEYPCNRSKDNDQSSIDIPASRLRNAHKDWRRVCGCCTCGSCCLPNKAVIFFFSVQSESFTGLLAFSAITATTKTGQHSFESASNVFPSSRPCP